MNMEMQCADVKTNESHTFHFSKPVQQFMVGFSRCVVEYDRPDHHVKRISIDLTDCQKNNNEVVVKPQLKMNDNSNHKESAQSSVKIVVIATVGDGNPNVQLMSSVETNGSYFVHSNNPAFVKAALTYANVEYKGGDHHLNKYSSTIAPVIQGNKFSIQGKAKLQDNGKNSDEKNVKGSAIICDNPDQYIMCADFDSKVIGESGTVCVGQVPDAFQHRDYDIACFINNYEVSFENKSSDHHVLKIEFDASLIEKHLIRNNDKVYAKVGLRSYLVDNGEHPFNIPHNFISGFIIAFKNK